MFLLRRLSQRITVRRRRGDVLPAVVVVKKRSTVEESGRGLDGTRATHYIVEAQKVVKSDHAIGAAAKHQAVVGLIAPTYLVE